MRVGARRGRAGAAARRCGCSCASARRRRAGRRRTRSGRCRARAPRSARASPPAAPGASTPRSVNAGTQRSVTSAITPSAPERRRARRGTPRGRARASSASVEPSASTSVSSATCEEMLRRRAPVPCVAVEIAPAMLWTSMSPRFSSASPCSARRAAQLADRDARLHAHEPAGAVDVEHARSGGRARSMQRRRCRRCR